MFPLAVVGGETFAPLRHSFTTAEDSNARTRMILGGPSIVGATLLSKSEYWWRGFGCGLDVSRGDFCEKCGKGWKAKGKLIADYA